jgi:hypothetical protein
LRPSILAGLPPWGETMPTVPRLTRGGGPLAGPHGWRGAPECSRRPAPPA